MRKIFKDFITSRIKYFFIKIIQNAFPSVTFVENIVMKLLNAHALPTNQI